MKQRSPAHVANAVYGGWVELDVPEVTTLSTGTPPRYAAYDLVVVDLQLQYDVEGCAQLVEDAAQCLSLWHVAGEAVEQESGCGVVLSQPVSHDRYRHLVGDQLTGVHVVLGATPELGRRRDAGPEDVTGGDLRDAVVRGEQFRLRALPRSRRPHQDNAHQRKNPS